LRREVLAHGRDRRGVHRGARKGLAEHPAPHQPHGRGDGDLDPRPDPGRTLGPGVPGLQLPRGRAVSDEDPGGGGQDRERAREARRGEPLRGGLPRPPRRGLRGVEGLGPRDQPPDGRDDPSLPRPPVPDRRPPRSRDRALPLAHRPRQALPRDRQPPVRELPGPPARGPAGAPHHQQAPLQPRQRVGGPLPSHRRALRVRQAGHDRDREQPRGGRRPLRPHPRSPRPRDPVRSVRARPALVFALALLAFVSLGLPDAVVGVAWPSIRRAFALPVDRLRVLLFTTMARYLVAGCGWGGMVRRTGVGGLLIASSLLVVASCAGYASAPSWPFLVAAAVPGGLGAGAIDAAINAYAAARFPAGRVAWLHACW